MRRRRIIAGYIARTLPGLLRNVGANVIKQCLGRRAYFSADQIFLKAYLGYLLGLTAAPKITSHGTLGEGAGSQARLTMCAIAFARTFKVPYVHTPFTNISHQDRPMAVWVQAWEELFNLGAGEEMSNEADDMVLDFAKHFSSFSRAIGRDSIYEALDMGRLELQRKYNMNRLQSPNWPIVVAVHIRRGDISRSTHPLMWQDLSETKSTIMKMTELLASHWIPYRLCIFSEGSMDEFGELHDLGAEFHISEDPVGTMEMLINAEILIMAKSFFSYVAGVNSRGICLYPPWDKPGLSDWIRCEQGGDFNAHEFLGRLEALCASRSRHERQAVIKNRSIF